jgi:hypothetical protein
MFSVYHSGSHHAPEPAREAWIVSRPLILISTTDLPTHVGRLRCTRSTLAIHCGYVLYAYDVSYRVVCVDTKSSL